MDPLLGPVQSDPEPVSAPSELPGAVTTAPGIFSQPGDGGAQTILDAWLQQLQTDQAEEPVVESRLDIDSLLSSEFEFDLDFLAELSSLKGASSGDGGVSLQELSHDLELGLLCPSGAALGPEPIDLGSLCSAELFPEQTPPTSTQNEASTTRPSSAASEAITSLSSASDRRGPDSDSAPPRPPPVVSVSVVTNKQQEKTVITISTPRGRQAFVLPTADLTQASRVLRALQQKRRRSRAAAAAAAAAAAPETGGGTNAALQESFDPSPDSGGRRSVEARGRKEKSHSDMNEASEDDPVMREALRHLGVDLARLERGRNGKAAAVTCPEPGCDMTTINIFKLKVHILQHRNYKPYKCSKEGCKWEFFERGKLNRHEATHMQASLKCGEPGCPAAFRTRTNLQRHRLRVHGLTSAAPAPPAGPAPPADPDPATPHWEAPDDPLSNTPYRCTFCDRAFRLAAGLKRHHDWHERQIARACSHPGCHFTASDQQLLRTHERRHAERQFKCTYPSCSWAFESHAKLKRHMSQHTGKRNFRCPYSDCGKSYRRMEYLSNHIRLHLGRFYRCPEKGCRLRFSRQPARAAHVRSAHGLWSPASEPPCPSAGPVLCPLCEARFKSEVYREIHLQDAHGTSTSKLLQPQSSAREEEDWDAGRTRRKSRFHPESLNWVEDGDPALVEGGDRQTYTVYVPFEVETDSGPSEVLVKCDVTEEECRWLGIGLAPEAGSEQSEQLAAEGDRLPEGNQSARYTARQLRRLGVGVLSAGLQRTSQSGCARTDITSCHLAGRRSLPRDWSGRVSSAGSVGPPSSLYDAGPGTAAVPACQATLEEPPSLLCDSDMLGSVHDQLQHSTINLSDLS